MPTVEAAIPKAALVTAGAKRIGRAIVDGLVARGFAVAVHANRSMAEAEAVAAAIRAAGGRAAAVGADLADAADVATLVERAEALVGPIGLLVNNASMFEIDGAANLDPALLRHHLAVNLEAPCLLASAMAARLPEGAVGLVVNIVDQRVWKPTPQFFSYSLSKAGLWWATRTMAQALAPRVRVMALGPGPTLKSARQQEEDFARQVAAVPLGRGPSLAEFDRAIGFLLETPSLTGQMIALDGGQHLAWETPDVVGVGE
jgi:NAD(P)-dependent dehydrogenase (short-subunit alcohol dehydrogenase family)